jgi:hypothetical protein
MPTFGLGNVGFATFGVDVTVVVGVGWEALAIAIR